MQNDPAAADSYEVRPILSNRASRYINFFYFFKIRRIIRETAATHLILEHPYYGWLGLALKWFTRIRLVVHSHNIEGLRWKTLGKWWWPVLWQYERFVHRRADFNFFIHDQDRDYAIRQFGLDPEKCITMTYGIEWDQIPGAEEKQRCRQQLERDYGISPAEKILFFNGAFSYSPNLEALRTLIHSINPILARHQEFSYKIIICGRDIPQDPVSGNFPSVIFAGFVDDVGVLFKGADVFLNPITEGGGIKTKLVEALGYDLNAVSTLHGALGIDPALCNGKLLICKDNDWNQFADLVLQASRIRNSTPQAYFDHFYWAYSTRKAAEFIQK